MAAQLRYCGRCGAQVQPGAPFCGRCGAPQVPQAFAAAPVYSYPVAPRSAYPTTRRFGASQVAIAGVLLSILAIVTVALSAFAVSRFTGGSRSTCLVNCAPKIITPLPESNTYRSSTYKFEVDYSSTWTVRSQDTSGISLGTRLGSVEVVGMKSAQSLQQVLQATVAALPSANWQDVVQYSDLKGAHIGDQDGLGAVYSANLLGPNATSTKVQFAVIVASRGGVTVVIVAVDPADIKNSPHGMPEAQSFDYMCSEFRWGT
ncbi:MAG TPA: zinc ribbon domain-containing protein [Candidatus Eisenbacteria bacterium]|nr:zinc ribbon domain-containing protein [Candidatus Eisenbacteria bacterium]